MSRLRLLLWLSLVGLTTQTFAEEPTVEDESADTPEEEIVIPPRPDLPSRHQLTLQRLQQQYPEQYHALDEEGLTAALYLPANHSEPHGRIILVPDSARPADASPLIDPLRQQLANSGWHSLSLQLPDPDFVALHVSPAPLSEPDSEENSDEEAGDDAIEAAPEPATIDDPDLVEPADSLPPDAEPALALPAEDDNDPLADTDEQPLAVSQATQIQQALSTAHTLSLDSDVPLTVVLAIGDGAWHAARWLHEQGTADALILITASTPPDSEPPLEQLIAPMKIPVQDYVLASQASLKPAQARKNAASRNPDSQYRQVLLREPIHSLQTAETLRRVKGWLTVFSRPPAKSEL